MLSAQVAFQSEASEKKIQLASTNWEPYTGEHLTDGGFLSAIVTEAFKEAGYQVTYHYRPWQRAVIETQNAMWDGVMDAYYLPEMTQYFTYSDPVWTVQLTFFALKERQIQYRKTQDLRPYIIGLTRGVEYEKELTDSGLHIEPVTRLTLNITKLLKGRIDLAIAAKSNILYVLRQDYPQTDQEKIEILNPPFKEEKVYVAFSKQKNGYRQLINEFNRGLQIIKEKGIYQQILRKHNIAAP